MHQMQTIQANQNITLKQENTQVNDLLDNTTPVIKSAIVNMITRVAIGDSLDGLGPMAGQWGVSVPPINLGDLGTFNPFGRPQ
uniref:DUF148 domain-containing protein n=1 Tax=Rhabditophanes sp. KR3021 TaxID=114890 RepID=A0AC35U1K2_9BILA